ncbi:Uncharacterised protein [uncultured archaeon]|nr:Uncharacterised protein [uncultured archaeon]
MPADLQKAYDAAWAQYKTAIENGDDQAAIGAKPAIAAAEMKINEIKTSCQPTTAISITTEKPAEVLSVTSNGAGGCVVPAELTQEYEFQWKKYNEAMANNDQATVTAVKATIAAIDQKFSDAANQCVKTVVNTDKVETSDVVSYYKEKMTEALSTTGDVDAQIEALKQLRADIDNTIAELIRKKTDFNASDAKGLVDEIKVKKNEIVAGSVSIANPTASINTEVNMKEIKVRSTSTGASINDGSISVATSEVSISNDKLMVGNNEVKVAPSEVGGKANMVVKDMAISTENSKAVYNANGTEKRKLLAVLPVEIEKNVKVDANTGDVISEDKPWWSALTTSGQ